MVRVGSKEILLPRLDIERVVALEQRQCFAHLNIKESGGKSVMSNILGGTALSCQQSLSLADFEMAEKKETTLKKLEAKISASSFENESLSKNQIISDR